MAQASASSRARPLTALDVSCIGVNAIVGSSIFLFPGKMAEYLGPASIAAFGLTGLLLTTVALCFAEASTHFDRPGGPYLYAREAFGDSVGYGIGWLCWVTELISLAAVANGISLYLGYFDPALAQPAAAKSVAVAVILGFGAVNYRGVKLGAWTSDAFTAAKLVPLLLLVAVGLWKLDARAFTPFAPMGWRSLGPACFLAYFAFQGFEVVPVPAGEVAEPERVVPRAVLAAMALSTVLYMLVQAAAVSAHPGLAGSERPLAEAAQRLMGPAGAALIAAGAALSMTGFCAGASLGGPRYLVALAADGHLPRGLARSHPRFATPSRAVLLTSLLCSAAALTFDFGRLVDIGNIVICAQYLATCAALPRLRRLRGGNRGFRAPGGLLMPALGVASTLWLGAQGRLVELGWAAAILALGFVLRRALAARA